MANGGRVGRSVVLPGGAGSPAARGIGNVSKGNRGKRPGTQVQHCTYIVIPAGAKRRAGIQNAAAFLD